MFKIIVWGFLLYMLYKFVFELLIPVSKASSQVKEKIREMQEQQNARQQYQPTAPPQEANQKPKKDDYIEFEEVKP